MPLPAFGIAMLFDLLLTEQGEASSPAPAVIPAFIAMLLWITGIVQGIRHVSGRDDLSGSRRGWWNLAIIFLWPVALPLMWAKLIRPLPNDAGENSA